MSEDYMSVKEASEKYRLSEGRIRQLLGAGTIQGRKFGNAWAVLASSLEEYLLTDRKPGPKQPRST